MSAINGLAGGAAVSGTTSRFNELSSEEFIKIIFTELQNQDPFKPNDSSALLQQLNSIRSIESDIQLGEQLESIVFQNQLASAGNLIGKRIAGMTADAQRVGGKVESVARTGDEIALILETGWIIPIDNVEYIDAEPAPGTGTGGGTGGGSGGTGGTGGSGGTNGGSGSGSGGGSGGGDGSGGGSGGGGG
ncbi:MAG: flagellar hook capping FlgD N-terminal domain-containing protein [Planctomycetota bacterium]